MGSNGRSLRDAVITGGVSGLVATFLGQHGVPAVEAVPIGMFVSGVVARGYRMLRAKYPWLSVLLGEDTPPS